MSDLSVNFGENHQAWFSYYTSHSSVGLRLPTPLPKNAVYVSLIVKFKDGTESEYRFPSSTFTTSGINNNPVRVAVGEFPMDLALSVETAYYGGIVYDTDLGFKTIGLVR
jgi:hypothetical protein